MVKRARGASRPGQRRPIERRSARPATASAAPPAPPRAAGLTETEAARAAELEAQILAEERTAEAARRRARTTRDRGVDEIRPSSVLATRAVDEYAYVARDVRRIVSVAVVLLIILAILWYVIEVMGVIKVT